MDMDFAEMNGMEADSDIVFLVHYGAHTIRIELPETSKVETVKRLIVKKTGLLANEFELLGWDVPDNVSDEVTFADLGIPKEYNLVLRPTNVNGNDPNDERVSRTFHIQINDAENDETYNLFFNGLQTVREVKEHFSQLSVPPVPLNRVNWHGWPWPIHDDQLLSDVGLKTPNHELHVSRIHDSVGNRPASERSQASGGPPDLLEHESMDDDDDDDEIVDMPPLVRQRGSLVPDIMLPMADSVRLFIHNFEARYGTNHAAFFAGTLREAMTAAFERPAPGRQLLAVYLHNDRSISVNIFVSQILQEQLLIDYIRDHVVLWPWDVTLPESRAAIKHDIEEILGPHSIGHFLGAGNVDKFPMMFICSKIRGSLELLRVLDGTKSATEVLNALEFVENANARNQEEELSEQQARLTRQLVVEEQNHAYQASLLADRAKEESKRAVKAQEKQKEDQQQELIRQKLKKQEDARASLPAEPQQGSGNGDGLTVIRLRTPDGKSLTRRFLASEPLKHLYVFAHANGYPSDEYNLVCNYPRKELNHLDPEKSFKDLSLTQQVAVFVEEH